NILITPTGQVKLTDFGIAKSMAASATTQTGMVVGTAQYISSEQAMGNDTTPAGDVYSLGVVGYECLAGRRPFVADSPVTIAMMHVRDAPPPLPDAIPAPVRGLLPHAMAKDPHHRYPDGEAFADAAADVRAGRPPRVPAGAAGPAGAPAGLAARAGAATTVLRGDTAAGNAGRAAPTRAYARVQPGPGPREHGGRQRAPQAPAPAHRRPAPPVTSRAPRRGRGGWGAWFLVAFILVALL